MPSQRSKAGVALSRAYLELRAPRQALHASSMPQCLDQPATAAEVAIESHPPSLSTLEEHGSIVSTLDRDAAAAAAAATAAVAAAAAAAAATAVADALRCVLGRKADHVLVLDHGLSEQPEERVVP